MNKKLIEFSDLHPRQILGSVKAYSENGRYEDKFGRYDIKENDNARIEIDNSFFIQYLLGPSTAIAGSVVLDWAGCAPNIALLPLWFAFTETVVLNMIVNDKIAPILIAPLCAMAGGFLLCAVDVVANACLYTVELPAKLAAKAIVNVKYHKEKKILTLPGGETILKSKEEEQAKYKQLKAEVKALKKQAEAERATNEFCEKINVIKQRNEGLIKEVAELKSQKEAPLENTK